MDEACAPEWIAEVVCLNVCDIFGLTLAVLFGKAILWVAFAHGELLPPKISDCITVVHNGMHSLNPKDPQANPVSHQMFSMTGEEGTVCMEDMLDTEGKAIESTRSPQDGTHNAPPPQATIGSNHQPLQSTIAGQNAL